MNAEHKKRDFVVLMLIAVVLFGNVNFISPICADYARTLGGLPVFIGIITGTLGAFSCFGSIFSAGMISRIKTKRLVWRFFSLLLVSDIMHLLTRSAFILFVARVVQGFSFGVSSVLISTSVTTAFSESGFAKMLGIYSAVQAISQAFAPTLGIFLRNNLGYPGALMFATGLAVTALLLIVIFNPFPDHHPDKTEKKERLGKTLVAYESLPIVFASVIAGYLAHAISSFLDPFTLMNGHTAGVELFFLVYALSMLALRLGLANFLSRGCLGYYILACAPITALGLFFIQIQQSVAVLLLAAVLCGIGVGCLQQAALVFLVNSVSPQRRNVANSSFFAACSLGRFCCGCTSGMVLGSSFADNLFYCYILLPAVLIVMCWVFPRHFFNKKRKDAEKPAIF